MDKTKLDQLLSNLKTQKQEIYTFKTHESDLLNAIENLAFLGELDKKNFYFMQIPQIWKTDENNKKVLHTLTDDELDEFYFYKGVNSLGEISIASCFLWFINLEKSYIRLFCVSDVADKDFLDFNNPKDSYGKAYEYFSQGNKLIQSYEFLIKDLEENDPIRITISKLITVVNCSSILNISEEFDSRNKQNVALYWGNLHHYDRLIDDIHQETAEIEYIQAVKPDLKENLDFNKNLLDVINGPSYEELDYDDFSYKATFDNAYQAENHFYSIIEFLNETKCPFDKIEKLEKHYLSGLWPMCTTEEESEELNESLQKFEVGVTKFQDKYAVKLEVWEMGIVYIITNIWSPKIVKK